MAIDNADVITEHGRVYRAGGQGVQDITTKFFTPLTSETHWKVIPTEKTLIDKEHASIDRVLQRFQQTFTPISTTTLKPDKCKLGHLKVDLKEYPDTIEDDWNGFLASDDHNRKDWPFTKFWLQELVMKQELDDYIKNEFYKGEEGTVTAGTATAAGRSINGLRWQLNNRTGVNSIAMGAIPTGASADEDFYKYVIDWFAQIPRDHRRLMDKVFMAEDLRDMFRRGARKANNVNYAQVPESEIDRIPDSTCRVVGLDSMTGDEKIFCMPAQFRMSYIKKPKNPNFFKLEESERAVKVMTDYYRQPWFWFAEYAYQNDLETSTLY